MAIVNASVTIRFTVPAADGTERPCAFDMEINDAMQMRLHEAATRNALQGLIGHVVDETRKACLDQLARTAPATPDTGEPNARG